MIDLTGLSDQDKVNLVQNRWAESATLWEVVERSFKKNRSYWSNNPDWVGQVPSKRSKARSNRIFLATESVLSNLLGRPSKPNVIPAQETDESAQLAEDLQDTFLEKYRTLGAKEKMRKGLRHLFMSRLVVQKVFWDEEKDDFNFGPVDTRRVRFSPKATSMYDTEYAIEEIPEKRVLDLVEMFPDKEEEILKKVGMDEKRARVENPKVRYREAWLGEEVVYTIEDVFLGSEPHPLWDFDGVPMTPNEQKKFENLDFRGKARESRRLEKLADYRKNSERKYESYLYNHFDNPIPPYVFGSVLQIEDGPIGASSLIEQVIPLQEEIDRRKRQISDNAEQMNGVVKVDTKYVTMTKAEAQQMKSEPRAIWYGDGVRDGVVIETGKELPSFITNDLTQSIGELDSVFGTQPTFRGEGGKQETATGRAILREQSFQRLDDLVDLVDSLHLQLYEWWFQMMKVKYSETHYIKATGADRATRVIEIMRNDLLDGVEIRVIPGQIMPEDKLFKAERAKEELTAGAIDPLTYFEETQRDNPEKLAKRLMMFKINPFSVVKLDQEDLQAIMEANQLMAQMQPQQAGDPKAEQVASVRQQAEAIINSKEFQSLPEDQKQQAQEQLMSQLKNLSQAK